MSATGGPPERPLRVGIVAEQLRRGVPGGIGTYTRALLGALAGLPGGPGSAAGVEPVVIRSRRLTGGDPEPFPVRGPHLPTVLVTRLWDRGLLAVDGSSDLLHSVSMAVPPPRRWLTVMVHDLAWRRCPDAYPARGLAWHEAALHRVASRAAAVVVPSHKVADELISSGAGFSADRVVVIPEGSDHLPDPDAAGAAQLLSRLGVEGGFLLCVGTLEPRKNLGRVVEAYSAVRSGLPEPWPLVVVGPQGWGPALRAAPGVVLAGRVPDAVLAALYRRARALCYVPLDEGYGLPVVEAMAAGAPVLSGLAVPAAEGAALQVEATDVTAIAEGMLAVSTDSAERDRLVALGRERASRCTWATTALAHARWWREVAGA